MSAIKKVILVGGGGSLGSQVLAQLREAFEVTVLSRQSSTSTIPSDVKVVKVNDDYPKDELVAAFKGHDALVSTITSTNSAEQISFVHAAVEAGIQRFIPAEFGSDIDNPEFQEAISVIKEKKAIRELLRSKESSTFTWTSITNNPFFDWCFSVTKGTFFKFDFANKKVVVLDDGNHPWSTTNLGQVALAVRRVLEKPEEYKNKVLFIESFTVTQNQLIEGVERELGVKFERDTVDSKEWLADAVKRSKAGNFQGVFDSLIGFSILCGSLKDKKGFANDLLGLPKEDFNESLKQAIKGI